MTDIGDTDFGVQVGIGFLGKVAMAAIGLVGSIVVARIVGPTGYGVFYISMAIAQFVENLMSGWAQACKKRMTEADFDAEEALGSVFIVIAAVVVVFGPLSYLLLALVTTNPVIPLAVPLLFTTISSYWALNTFLSGRENFSMSIWSGTVNTFVQIVGKIALVVAGFGVWGMLGGTVLGPVLVMPLIFRWIGVRPELPSRETLSSIATYARWSIPSGFLGTALSRMDTILLGWLVAAGAAGKYQVGLKLTMPAVFISGVIGTGLMGRVSNLESRGRNWSEDLWNSLSYGSLLSVPIFFGSLVLGEPLAVTVFGGEYAGAGVFVVGLALYRVVKTQLSPFRSVISGLDRPDLIFRVSLVSFVTNVLLGVGLWYEFGAVGIVVATVLTVLLNYAMTVGYVRRITEPGPLLTRPFRRQLLSGTAMAAIVFTLRSSFGIPGWPAVFGYLAVGGVVYGGMVVVLIPHLRVTARGIWEDFSAEYV